MHPSDLLKDAAHELEQSSEPSILISPDYQILASNGAYRKAFGDGVVGHQCFAVSHGYDSPCDEHGELCPLARAKQVKGPARVLHVHQTPRGPEHVDVALRPVWAEDGRLAGFIEHLRPIEAASAQAQPGAQVGISRAFNAALELALRAAPTDVPVLLLGESGTGKERLARAVHDASPRRDGPFVAVACSGLAEALFESELFGHEKGAFTGAHSRKEGLVEAAATGTLFLDEVGDIPLSLQVKLLRLLESRTYRRVGGTRPIKSDFRLVCATWRDLDARIAEGAFRPDLYFRIAAFPIVLPPLRERVDDLDLLIPAILEELRAHARPSPEALNLLRAHSWPGNVRELRNVLQRAAILADGCRIEAQHLKLGAPQVDSRPASPDSAAWPWGDQLLPLEEVETRYLEWCLTQLPEDRSELARRLGVSERTLYRKLARLRPALQGVDKRR